MKKRIAVVMIMLFGVFGLTGCGPEGGSKEETVTQEGFSMTILVNKTKIKAGDKIQITITLKNESGQNIPIQLTDAATYNGGELENIFNLDVCPKQDAHLFNEIGVVVEQRASKTVDINATITRTFDYLFDEAGGFKVAVAVFFYIGDGFTEMLRLESHSIHISVV